MSTIWFALLFSLFSGYLAVIGKNTLYIAGKPPQ